MDSGSLAGERSVTPKWWQWCTRLRDWTIRGVKRRLVSIYGNGHRSAELSDDEVAYLDLKMRSLPREITSNASLLLSIGAVAAAALGVVVALQSEKAPNLADLNIWAILIATLVLLAAASAISYLQRYLPSGHAAEIIQIRLSAGSMVETAGATHVDPDTGASTESPVGSQTAHSPSTGSLSQKLTATFSAITGILLLLSLFRLLLSLFKSMKVPGSDN